MGFFLHNSCSAKFTHRKYHHKEHFWWLSLKDRSYPRREPIEVWGGIGDTSFTQSNSQTTRDLPLPADDKARLKEKSREFHFYQTLILCNDSPWQKNKTKQKRSKNQGGVAVKQCNQSTSKWHTNNHNYQFIFNNLCVQIPKSQSWSCTHPSGEGYEEILQRQPFTGVSLLMKQKFLSPHILLL